MNVRIVYIVYVWFMILCTSIGLPWIPLSKCWFDCLQIGIFSDICILCLPPKKNIYSLLAVPGPSIGSQCICTIVMDISMFILADCDCQQCLDDITPLGSHGSRHGIWFPPFRLERVFTDHTLAHPLNCRGAVVARLSAYCCTRILNPGLMHEGCVLSTRLYRPSHHSDFNN